MFFIDYSFGQKLLDQGIKVQLRKLVINCKTARFAAQ
jgi:hypothetical protein